MIMCDNSACSIQWFHCDCLRIRRHLKANGIAQHAENYQSFREEKTKESISIVL